MFPGRPRIIAMTHAASAESGLEWLLEWEQLRPFVPSGGGHGRALDLGCGRSVAPARLRAECGYAEVIGLDSDAQLVAACAAEYCAEGLRFACVDATASGREESDDDE